MKRFAAWRAWIVVLSLIGPALMAASSQNQPESSGASIVGQIFSAENGEPLPYANIMLYKLTAPDDTLGVAITGTFAMAPEGSFRLAVSPGMYRLQATHISHKMLRSGVILVGPNQAVTQDLTLSTTTTLVLPGFHVRAKLIRDTEKAMLIKQKEAEVVANAISAEQIKKSTDSNAAEALSRVSGLSLIDDKYVFVRGMGERYSSTQINSATVGSPEPNKRVVPLDLIPANMIDNAWIVKTYSPELPAEFGGGGVNINTRDTPGGRTWSLAVTSGYDGGTTGGSFMTYEGGKLDFLGFDDGTRDLPDFFKEVAGDTKVSSYSPLAGTGFKPDTLEQLGECFNQTWVPTTETAAPRYNLEGSFGDEVQILGRTLGFMLGGVFKTSFDTYAGINNSYRPGSTEGELEPNTEYDVRASTAKRMLSFLDSINLRTGENTNIHLRTMYNRSAADETRTYEGQNHDTSAYMRNTRLRWLERTLLTSNLGIDHTIAKLRDSVLEWRVDYSRAELNEPDRREYNYELRETASGDFWEISSRGPSRGFTRMFGNLTEKERGFHASWDIALSSDKAQRSRLKIGYGLTSKKRDSAYRRLAFKIPGGRPFDYSLPPESLMVDEHIGFSPTKHFVLTELTRPEDSYRASMDVASFFFLVDMPLSRRLRMSGGARLEDWKQEVVTMDPFASDPSRVIQDEAKLSAEDWLPALNLTYLLRENTNVRAGFSRTISRPDLRELSSFTMPDYDSGFEVRGNPELKRATILNYDLRCETFPQPEEMASISLFYKRLKDPIENSLVSAGGQLRKVPVNAEWAWIYGSEIEFRVLLDHLKNSLASFTVVSNLTLTKSRARVPLTSFSEGSRQRERTLQGQSPYLLNLMLSYAPPAKPFHCSVTYNAFGKRLRELGLEKMPDAYEQAHYKVDVAMGYQLGRYKMKLSVKNLFNRDSEHTMGGFVSESYKDERSYQFKIGMGQ